MFSIIAFSVVVQMVSSDNCPRDGGFGPSKWNQTLLSKCDKKCPARDNYIVISTHTSENLYNLLTPLKNIGLVAGMNDREGLYLTLGTLAEMVCAQIVVPPPCMQLAWTHNGGKHVDCKWDWAHYRDFKRPDGEPLLTEAREVPMFSNRAILPTAPRWCDSEAALKAALLLKFENVPFVLYVSVDFLWHQITCEGSILNAIYRWNFLSRDCNYKPTATHSHLALRVAAEVIESHSNFISLHIRRGDIVELCDTSPLKVDLFMNCWLEEDERNFDAIILLTDETDQSYLTSVIQVLRKYSLHVIHGDQQIITSLNNLGILELDNYVVYGAGKVIEEQAAKKTEFGGHGENQFEQCERMTRCSRNGNI
jgi:hypothetical protein